MSVTIFGWENTVTDPASALSSGSAEVSLPVANLATQQGAPSTAWQTAAGIVTSAGGSWFSVTPSQPHEIDAIGIFGTNLTGSAVVTALVKRGGSTIWTGTATPVPGFQQVILLPPRGTIGDLVVVNIDDPGNPDRFINVPLAYIGRTWQPATSSGFETAAGRDDSTVDNVSRGGQESPTLQWQRRRWEVALNGVRANEIWGQLDQMRQVSRSGENVLFINDVTSAYIQQEACFGRMRDVADITYPYAAADRRAWRGRITERL